MFLLVASGVISRSDLFDFRAAVRLLEVALLRPMSAVGLLEVALLRPTSAVGLLEVALLCPTSAVGLLQVTLWRPMSAVGLLQVALTVRRCASTSKRLSGNCGRTGPGNANRLQRTLGAEQALWVGRGGEQRREFVRRELRGALQPPVDHGVDDRVDWHGFRFFGIESDVVATRMRQAIASKPPPRG